MKLIRPAWAPIHPGTLRTTFLLLLFPHRDIRGAGQEKPECYMERGTWEGDAKATDVVPQQNRESGTRERVLGEVGKKQNTLKYRYQMRVQ